MNRSNLPSRPWGLLSGLFFHSLLLWMTGLCLVNCLTTHYRATAESIYQFPGPWGWLDYASKLTLLGVGVGLTLSARDIQWMEMGRASRALAWAGLVLNLLLIVMPLVFLWLLSEVFHIDFD